MRLLFVNQKPLFFLKACLQLSCLKPQTLFLLIFVELNNQGQTVTYKLLWEPNVCLYEAQLSKYDISPLQ